MIKILKKHFFVCISLPLFIFFISSTASSGFNSLAAVTYEDIFKKIVGDLPTDKAARVSKIIGKFVHGDSFE